MPSATDELEKPLLNQDEQDAVIGKVIRRRKEASLKLKSLQNEAETLGTLLVDIGDTLRKFPENVYSHGETCNEKIATREPYRLPTDFPTDEKIQQLTKDIRECIAQLDDLEKQRVALGI